MPGRVSQSPQPHSRPSMVVLQQNPGSCRGLLLIYGAEDGNRQNECSTMLLSAVMPFMLVFSPLVHIAVSG